MEDKLVAVKTRTNEPLMPPRPNFGTKGISTLVRANYFPVALPTQTLFKYDVAMTPDPKIKRIRKRVFQLLELTSFRATRDLMATDYAKTIITAKKLEIADDKLQVEVRYYDADQEGPHEKSKVYAVTITLVQLLEPDSLKHYVNGLDPDFDSSPAIQALNIILAKPPSQNPAVIPLGKSKFFVSEPNPHHQQLLLRGLLALRGYYSSIRPSMGRVLCNVNVCMTAFYKYVWSSVESSTQCLSKNLS